MAQINTQQIASGSGSKKEWIAVLSKKSLFGSQSIFLKMFTAKA